MGKNNNEHIKTISTSLFTTEYSMYDFIKAIRECPVIWDRRDLDFHHRDKREQAWKNVVQKLCRSFDMLEADEQQKLVKLILSRWKNTRDCFLRALRMQQLNDERARPYIYEKELMFLLGVRKNNDTQQNESKEAEGSQKDAALKKSPNKALASPAQSKRLAAANHSIVIKRLKLQNSPNSVKVVHQQRTNIKTMSAKNKDTVAVKQEMDDKTPKKTPEELVDDSQQPSNSPQLRSARLRIKTLPMQSIKTNKLPLDGTQPTGALPTLQKQNAISTPLLLKGFRNCKVLMSTPIRDHASTTPIKNLKIRIKNENGDPSPTDVVNTTTKPKELTVTSTNSCLEVERFHQQPSEYETSKSSDDIVNNSGSPMPSAGNDADQSFFDSIKPDLRKLNETQKLDFKIEILKILKTAISK